MDNTDLKRTYNSIGEKYNRNWDSLAKKRLSEYELRFIRNALKPQITNKKIKLLELGFGTGRIMKCLLEYNVEYYGADISREMINAAKKDIKKNQKIKELRMADITQKIPFQNTAFDVIVAMRMLYDNKKWKEILGNLGKRLKPGGIIIFNTHNKYSSLVFHSIFRKPSVGFFDTSLKELSEVLDNNDFSYKIIGFGRFPDPIYDLCNSPWSANLLFFIENFLDRILGRTFLTRMFYVVTKKNQ